MKRLRANLTYANVMATVAVFLVLGGSAIAATQLPADSVGTKQLKKGAVTPGKLSAKARRIFAGAPGPTGDRGAQGPEGPPGTAGKEGAPGQNLTAETPLPSGHTETGVFGAAGGESPFLLAAVSFVQPLTAGLDGEHAFLLEEHESSNPHCPGVGRADPGYFCAYIGKQGNVGLAQPEDPGDGLPGTGKGGTTMFFFPAYHEAGAFATGTWAVTAP